MKKKTLIISIIVVALIIIGLFIVSGGPRTDVFLKDFELSQDGRIFLYPDYNIRVSSQNNVYGEKFVLRLLKKNQNIKGLHDLGFPKNKNIRECFEKRNSITIMGAPTGEGKTTSLYAIIN